MNFIVAIDGYVGTGKGTIGKWVAKALGFLYLDTGSMYRAVTLYAMRHGLIDASDAEKIAMMTDMSLSYRHNNHTDNFDMYLHDENIEKDIRATDIWLNLPKIVPIQWIRNILVALQRSLAETWWVVMDGRDIGTIVFPHADLKLFLVCDLETRVERRYKQLLEQWHIADTEKIRTEIELRDYTDYLWPNAVNKKADDAIVIDTTRYTMQEYIDTIVTIVKNKLSASGL